MEELNEKLDRIKKELADIGEVEVYTWYSQEIHGSHYTELFANTEEEARAKFEKAVLSQFGKLESDEYVSIDLDGMHFNYKNEWSVFVEKEKVTFGIEVKT